MECELATEEESSAKIFEDFIIKTNKGVKVTNFNIRSLL